MPPTLKDTDFASSETSAIRPASSGSPQTVALEVPVTVNGVRPVEYSDKREPFAEATKTVLVHSAGAVIRLASAVAPGQLLFLTNDKTKKEVVCQVVKSKSHGNVSGYVELQFTEPVQGFWGLGFPAERSAGSPASTRPPVLSPLGQNMELRPPISNSSAKSTDPVAADEFKTEIKQDSRPMSKADFLTAADNSTQALKIETSRLQEQLSSLLFAEPAGDDVSRTASTPTSAVPALSDATTKLFEIASKEARPKKAESTPERLMSPAIPAPKAPVSAGPAFEAEEVKIPAWLAPLARNAAIPAPPEPASSSNMSTSTSTTSELEELSVSEPHQPAPMPPSRATVPAAPVFGRALLGTAASAPTKVPRGNKSILITAVAAGIVLATAGVTWYLRQSSGPGAKVEATNSAALRPPVVTLPAATAPSAADSSSASNSYAQENSSPEVRPEQTASGSDLRAASSTTAAKMQAAAISEHVSQPADPADASKTPNASTEETEPEGQRPSLGRVRLAKPRVGRNAHMPLSGDAAPTLEADSEQPSSGDSPLSGGLLAGNANQPAAPAPVLPVGGDVVTAHLISSVPPMYPAMARTQHISGDVRVDALIGANGRVSSMKVVAGPTILHQAAMDALRQWKYQPATLDGKPVAMHLTVTIQFRLQ
jgi:TonB family protein